MIDCSFFRVTEGFDGREGIILRNPTFWVGFLLLRYVLKYYIMPGMPPPIPPCGIWW